MKISFKCFNMTSATNLMVSEEENLVLLNNQKINVNAKELANKILNITLSWSGEYNSCGLDGEEFNLKIEHDGYTKVVNGSINMPPRYSELKELIKELNKC